MLKFTYYMIELVIKKMCIYGVNHALINDVKTLCTGKYLSIYKISFFATLTSSQKA